MFFVKDDESSVQVSWLQTVFVLGGGATRHVDICVCWFSVHLMAWDIVSFLKDI